MQPQLRAWTAASVSSPGSLLQPDELVPWSEVLQARLEKLWKDKSIRSLLEELELVFVDPKNHRLLWGLAEGRSDVDLAWRLAANGEQPLKPDALSRRIDRLREALRPIYPQIPHDADYPVLAAHDRGRTRVLLREVARWHLWYSQVLLEDVIPRLLEAEPSGSVPSPLVEPDRLSLDLIDKVARVEVVPSAAEDRELLGLATLLDESSSLTPDPASIHDDLPLMAVWLLARGRILALLGRYPKAAEHYERAYKLVLNRIRHVQAGKYDAVSDRALHFIGLLSHELANAESLFGVRHSDRGGLKGFSPRSRLSENCYKELKRRGDLSHGVKLGYVRAVIVRQQGECYKGQSDRVAKLESDIEAAISFASDDQGNPIVTDWYGWAKSQHFRAQCYFFQGDYASAVEAARKSCAYADKVNPFAWVQMRRRPSLLPLELDKWWAFRDGGFYGKSWWRAIAHATAGDMLACLVAQGHEEYRREAQEHYQISREIYTPRRWWNRSNKLIGSMITAKGLYEWLLVPIPKQHLDARDYLTTRLHLAERAGFVICQVQVALCWRDYWRQMRDKGPSTTGFQLPAKVEREWAKYTLELAQDLDNQYMIDLAVEGRPYPAVRGDLYPTVEKRSLLSAGSSSEPYGLRP